MADNTWSMVWHQAMTRSFLDGKAFGWNKTVAFCVSVPVSGEQVRIRFSNRHGAEPAQIGALTLVLDGAIYPVTMEGKSSFDIPVGSVCYSDPCAVSVARGQTMEVRLYYTNAIIDSNMIEERATLLRGNHTADRGTLPFHKPALAKALGAYDAVPAIEAVEVLTEEPAYAIVAFGDSITALSQWTKPLARRIDDVYQGKYVLLNSGISGNCLLHVPEGIFAPVFGDKGIERFERDVLDVPNLHTVIFGLGVNDVSYLTDETADHISLAAYQEAVTSIVSQLHDRGVRVAMQTITPRLGVARTMGKYEQPMEDLRLALNDWIRSAGIFDYVFDAEAVVRDQCEDGWYFAEGIHQGDHLHPNAKGGQLLADAWDLAQLVGEA